MSYQPVTKNQIDSIKSNVRQTQYGQKSFNVEPFKEIGKCFFDFSIVDHHRVIANSMVDEWFESAVPY